MSFLLSLVFVLCLPQNNTKTVQKSLVQKHFCNVLHVVMFLHLSFLHISTKRHNSLVLKVKKGIQRSDCIQIRSRHCLKMMIDMILIEINNGTKFWKATNQSCATSAEFPFSTGKSLSEAFIFALTNPQYDKRLFIELQVQYMKIASSEHVENMLCTYINCSECQNKMCVHNMF